MTRQQHNVNCCEVHRIPMNKTCGDDASRTSALTNGSQGLQTSAWVPNYHFYGVSHKFCKLISCFTSPPINHIVFFCFCRIPVVLENHRSSQGVGEGVVCTPLHPAPRSAPGTLLLRLLLDTGPPYYVAIRATQRSCSSQGRASTFMSQLFQDPEYWSHPGNRARNLRLCSQVLYRLS